MRYTYVTSRNARPAERPRRRPMDNPSVRKRHLVRKLAFPRQVAGNVLVVGCESTKFFADIVMRIEHKRAQAHFMANEAKWRGKVHIPADNYKSVSRLAHDVCHHLCGKIDVGALLDCPVNNAIGSFLAAFARFFCEWEFYLKSLVESFYDLDLRERAKGIKISILVECGMRICRIVSYSGREIFDGNYLMLVRSWKKRSGKSFEIEPLIGSIFQQPMMEIESIDIKNRLLHLRYYGLQRQGPDFRPAPHRIAVAQRVVSNPSRGSSVFYQIRDAA